MGDIRTLITFIALCPKAHSHRQYLHGFARLLGYQFCHTLPQLLMFFLFELLAVEALSCTAAPCMIQTMYSIRLGGSNFMQSG
jgi:hypothetical protein